VLLNAAWLHHGGTVTEVQVTTNAPPAHCDAQVQPAAPGLLQAPFLLPPRFAKQRCPVNRCKLLATEMASTCMPAGTHTAPHTPAASAVVPTGWPQDDQHCVAALSALGLCCRGRQELLRDVQLQPVQPRWALLQALPQRYAPPVAVLTTVSSLPPLSSSCSSSFAWCSIHVAITCHVHDRCTPLAALLLMMVSGSTPCHQPHPRPSHCTACRIPNGWLHLMAVHSRWRCCCKSCR
jgi:hypothetical protein